MNPLTLKLIASAVAAALLFSAGYRLGSHLTHSACEADKAAGMQRLITQQAAVAAQDNEVLATHEVANERIRVVYRTITQKANDYAITHHDDACGLDADGLRIWNAANANDTAPATSQPDYTLPAVASTKIGADSGSANQSRGDGTAVLPVPRESSSAGGLE
jgi:hypothetical protein